MARLPVWNPRITLDGTELVLEGEDQPCPGCRGRGDDGCLSCGGEGYV